MKHAGQREEAGALNCLFDQTCRVASLRSPQIDNKQDKRTEPKKNTNSLPIVMDLRGMNSRSHRNRTGELNYRVKPCERRRTEMKAERSAAIGTSAVI